MYNFDKQWQNKKFNFLLNPVIALCVKLSGRVAGCIDSQINEIVIYETNNQKLKWSDKQ